jgi:hypothetical protein
VAVVHLGYVLFVVAGMALILVGIAREWEWVRDVRFRLAHLAAIVAVCVQSLAGIQCPLTTLENRLRAAGGAIGYPHDFLGYWADRLVFYDLPAWIFSAAYIGFALAVAAVFIIAPPQWRRQRFGTKSS